MIGTGFGIDGFGAIAGGAGVGFGGAGLSKKEKSAVAHASDLGAVGIVVLGVIVRSSSPTMRNAPGPD